jgi:hypothetical protein
MNRKAVSLIELLISLIILGLVILGFSSLDLFSSRQVSAANKKISTQNDAIYITEFIAKETNKAIGNFNAPPTRPISVGGETGIALKIDVNENGRWDSPPDKEIAFLYRGAVGSNNYQIRYYADFFDAAPGSFVVVSNKAFQFVPVVTDNYLFMEIATCWNPRSTTDPCGSWNNPAGRVRSRIMMPAVSTH